LAEAAVPLWAPTGSGQLPEGAGQAFGDSAADPSAAPQLEPAGAAVPLRPARAPVSAVAADAAPAGPGAAGAASTSSGPANLVEALGTGFGQSNRNELIGGSALLAALAALLGLGLAGGSIRQRRVSRPSARPADRSDSLSHPPSPGRPAIRPRRRK
jgi:hypothetical protein